MKKNQKENLQEKSKLKLPTWVWALPIASLFLLLIVFSFNGNDRPAYMDVKYVNTEVKTDPFVPPENYQEVEPEYNPMSFIENMFSYPNFVIFIGVTLSMIFILNIFRRRW